MKIAGKHGNPGKPEIMQNHENPAESCIFSLISAEHTEHSSWRLLPAHAEQDARKHVRSTPAITSVKGNIRISKICLQRFSFELRSFGWVAPAPRDMAQDPGKLWGRGAR